MERQKREQEQQRKSCVPLNVSRNLGRPLLEAIDGTMPQEMPTVSGTSVKGFVQKRTERHIFNRHTLL